MRRLDNFHQGVWAVLACMPAISLKLASSSLRVEYYPDPTTAKETTIGTAH